MNAQLLILESLIDQLPTQRDKDFAVDLVFKGKRYGTSEKQLYWVNVLIDKATKPAPVVQEIGDLSAVIALIETARKHLQHPKIRIMVGTTKIVLSIAGERAKVPGSINVATEGGYGNSDWFGRITRDGQFHPSSKALEGLVDVLKQFAKDPILVAKQYAEANKVEVDGRLIGSCCFCTKPLSDQRSTDAGYGGKCASNYNLPWGGKKKARKSDADYEAACESEEACRHEARMY